MTQTEREAPTRADIRRALLTVDIVCGNPGERRRIARGTPVLAIPATNLPGAGRYWLLPFGGCSTGWDDSAVEWAEGPGVLVRRDEVLFGYSELGDF
jgi:hypothetical protein